jgi:hypothetical protein
MPDSVKILETKQPKVCFMVLDTPLMAVWNRDFSWDFALADMTLHPECYTLEQKRKIRAHTQPQIGELVVHLEPVGQYQLGYCQENNVLCVGSGNRG